MVAEDEFYFTNYYHFTLLLELPLAIPWGSVGFHNGNKSKIVATKFYLPNGITKSPDGR